MIYNYYVARRYLIASINTTIRIDEELKKQAEDLFNDFGLTLNAAITMYIKQAVREQRIPFEITRNVPNQKTIEAIKELDEMDKHPENYKKYNSAEELMEDILK